MPPTLPHPLQRDCYERVCGRHFFPVLAALHSENGTSRDYDGNARQVVLYHLLKQPFQAFRSLVNPLSKPKGTVSGWL